MEARLIKYVCGEKEKFRYEDYRPDGKLLVLMESGSFVHRIGDTLCRVLPTEGLYYHEGKTYYRMAEAPMKLHFFRFVSEEDLFDDSIVRFSDRERILSDFALLNRLDAADAGIDCFSYQAHIFEDIVRLYSLEHRLHEKEPSDPCIHEAIRFITHRTAEVKSVAALAEMVHLSYVQFLRRFRASTGLAPCEYIARVRERQAEHMLTGTDLCVREIARLCGFENEFYFSTFFRKRTGVSPQQYRRSIE